MNDLYGEIAYEPGRAVADIDTGEERMSPEEINDEEVQDLAGRQEMSESSFTLDEKKKKRKKAGTESSKESSLRDWFGRKGAKGKKKGWVDCNAPDGKGGYKACGRGSGEKRKKYPACRPTAGACKERGKGKSWGKKAKKKSRKNEEFKMDQIELESIIGEELEAVLDEKAGKKDACYHKVKSRYKVWPSAYASGALVKCRKVGAKNWGNSKKEELEIDERNQELEEIVKEELEAVLNEKKTDKEKMKCNSPRRIRKGEAGHGKKKFVVKACDGGTEKIIRYGDANMEIKRDSPARRKSFRARHNCKNPGSKLKARYWSCKKW
jgi:predicted component of type VI protein secretion system